MRSSTEASDFLGQDESAVDVVAVSAAASFEASEKLRVASPADGFGDTP